ncbi:hypothetical protein ACFQYP_30990 [Nonomuraea antimicrobica]
MSQGAAGAPWAAGHAYPPPHTRPGQPAVPARRGNTGWIVAGAAAGALVLAVAGAFVAVRIALPERPATPTSTAAADTPTTSTATTSTPTTTAPTTPATSPPATRSVTLPGTSVRLQERDTDPIRLASYTLDSGERLYVRKYATGEFTRDTRYFEYALDPATDRALATDVDYSTDLFATVSIVDHATDDRRVVKLSRKPVFPTTPRWSPDGRYGLVTLYKDTDGESAEYGYGIIDVAAGTGRAFQVKEKGAGSGASSGTPTVRRWAPGSGAG